MRKFTYWIAVCLNDSSSYTVRGKTRREVLQRLDAMGARLDHTGAYTTEYGSSFEAPKRHTIEYEDTFDLVCQCLSDSRGCE